MSATGTPEPATTPAEGETPTVCIGIDLGTTYSCVAVWENDAVVTIANDLGARTTPSWVAFTDEERLVGQAAMNQSAMNPNNSIFDAKRLIGRLYDDPAIQEDLRLWPFTVQPNSDNKPVIKVSIQGTERLLTPEEVSAMVLGRMKATAEAYLGHPVTDAVVTVPAYFNDSQRRATKDAGAIAGLNVKRIINEPTAAAIAYGLDTKDEGARSVLIFDLGGGTFDVSVLVLEAGVFTVKATAGNTHLGGEDFDQALVNHCVAEFKKKNGGLDLTTSSRSLRRLRSACERAKRALSSAVSAQIEVDALFEGIDFNLKISKAKFESLCADLFQACLEPVQKVLTDAGVKKEEIDEIVLVGGSTRIPRVQELLSEYFGGKVLNKSIHPDEAVAYGAAVQGAILSGQSSSLTQDLLLLDVTPLSLGVDTVGGIMNVIIPRNSTIPCRRSEPFTTVDNNQTSIEFNIYEGERPSVDGNHKLGTFDLTGIPPAKRGEPQITVTMDLDANGILTVTAVDELTKKSANVVISNAAGRLKPEEITRMMEEAAQFAEADRAALKLQEARREIGDYCYRVMETVEEVSGVDDDQKEAVMAKCEELIDAIDSGDDLDTLNASKKELEGLYNPIISAILRERTRR